MAAQIHSSKILIKLYCILIGIAPLSVYAVDPDYSHIERGEGNVPILLSAPHGGWLQPSDVDTETTGNHYVDTNTYPLSGIVKDTLVNIYGAEPYFVFAKFHRRWIDANRAPGTSDAWTDPDAEKYYEGYHQSIRDYIDEISATWGKGILIDIHGQSDYRSKILRGTRDGLTVEDLLDAEGLAGLTGPSSVFGQINIQGYTVFPTNDSPLGDPPEYIEYNGGYIVYHYGSHHADGLDAIQVEIGRDFRDSSGPNYYGVLGEALGISIAECYSAFYSESPTIPLSWSDVKCRY
jgi:N-formylglutamate amidohydrolase